MDFFLESPISQCKAGYIRLGHDPNWTKFLLRKILPGWSFYPPPRRKRSSLLKGPLGAYLYPTVNGWVDDLTFFRIIMWASGLWPPRPQKWWMIVAEVVATASFTTRTDSWLHSCWRGKNSMNGPFSHDFLASSCLWHKWPFLREKLLELKRETREILLVLPTQLVWKVFDFWCRK